jgi:hypothetical protein
MSEHKAPLEKRQRLGLVGVTERQRAQSKTWKIFRKLARLHGPQEALRRLRGGAA